MDFIHNLEKKRIELYEKNNQLIGYIHYTEDREGILKADSTHVFKDFEGKGYAGKLLDQLAAFARQEGKKILPECSYVEYAFLKYKEKYKDVAKQRTDEDGPIVEKCPL